MSNECDFLLLPLPNPPRVCAKNYATQHGTKECKECGVTDDENHRINSCMKYSSVNLYNSTEKIEFNDIYYHDDDDKVMNVVRTILSVWDLAHGKNEVRCN